MKKGQKPPPHRNHPEPFELGDFIDWAESVGVVLPNRAGWPAWERLMEMLVTYDTDPGPGMLKVIFENGHTWHVFEDHSYFPVEPMSIVLDQNTEPAQMTGQAKIDVGVGTKREADWDLTNEESALKNAKIFDLTLKQATDQMVPDCTQGLNSDNAKPSSKFPCTLTKAKGMTLAALGNPKATFDLYYTKNPYVRSDITLGGVAGKTTVTGLQTAYPKSAAKSATSFQIPFTACNQVQGCYPWITSDTSDDSIIICPPDDPDHHKPPIGPIIDGIILLIAALVARKEKTLSDYYKIVVGWYGTQRATENPEMGTEMMNIIRDAKADTGKDFTKSVEGAYNGFKFGSKAPTADTLGEGFQASKLAANNAGEFVKAFSSTEIKYGIAAVAGAALASFPAAGIAIATSLVTNFGLKPNQSDSEKLGLTLKDKGFSDDPKDTNALSDLLFNAYYKNPDKEKQIIPIRDFAVTIVNMAAHEPADDTMDPDHLATLLVNTYKAIEKPTAKEVASALKAAYDSLSNKELVSALKTAKFNLVDTAGALFDQFPDISCDDFVEILYTAFKKGLMPQQLANDLVTGLRNTNDQAQGGFDACQAYESLTTKTTIPEDKITDAISRIYDVDDYVMVVNDGSLVVQSKEQYNFAKGPFSLMLDLEAKDAQSGILMMRAKEEDGLLKGFCLHADTDGRIDIYAYGASGGNSISVEGTPLLDKKRHTIIVSRFVDNETATFRFFVDGQEYKPLNPGKGLHNINVDAPLDIASPVDRPNDLPSGFFHGNIHEVKIWNVAKTPQDTTDDGLIGHWNFKKGSFEDYSTVGNKNCAPVPREEVKLVFDPCSTTKTS